MKQACVKDNRNINFKISRILCVAMTGLRTGVLITFITIGPLQLIDNQVKIMKQAWVENDSTITS